MKFRILYEIKLIYSSTYNDRELFHNDRLCLVDGFVEHCDASEFVDKQAGIEHAQNYRHQARRGRTGFEPDFQGQATDFLGNAGLCQIRRQVPRKQTERSASEIFEFRLHFVGSIQHSQRFEKLNVGVQIAGGIVPLGRQHGQFRAVVPFQRQRGHAVRTVAQGVGVVGALKIICSLITYTHLIFEPRTVPGARPLRALRFIRPKYVRT